MSGFQIQSIPFIHQKTKKNQILDLKKQGERWRFPKKKKASYIWWRSQRMVWEADHQTNPRRSTPDSSRWFVHAHGRTIVEKWRWEWWWMNPILRLTRHLPYTQLTCSWSEAYHCQERIKNWSAYYHQQFGVACLKLSVMTMIRRGDRVREDRRSGPVIIRDV